MSSWNDGARARLAAVRAGITHYLVKPHPDLSEDERATNAILRPMIDTLSAVIERGRGPEGLTKEQLLEWAESRYDLRKREQAVLEIIIRNSTTMQHHKGARRTTIGRDELVKQTGYCLSSVQHALTALREKKLVTRQYGHRGEHEVCTYIFTMHPQ